MSISPWSESLGVSSLRVSFVSGALLGRVPLLLKGSSHWTSQPWVVGVVGGHRAFPSSVSEVSPRVSLRGAPVSLHRLYRARRPHGSRLGPAAQRPPFRSPLGGPGRNILIVRDRTFKRNDLFFKMLSSASFDNISTTKMMGQYILERMNGLIGY